MDSLIWLYARIVVNVDLFVLDLMGIKVSLSKIAMSRTIGKAFEFLGMNPEAKAAITKFILAFKTAWEKNDASEMAKCIYQIMKDLQAGGLLWMIIESVVSEMSKWDWFMTAVGVSLNITAMLATEGFALIAKMAGAVLSAKNLIDLVLEAFKRSGL